MKNAWRMGAAGLGIAAALMFSAYTSDSGNSDLADVCVNVKGNQKHLVHLRVGPNDHSGACCTGVSNYTTVKICGKAGYNVYDSDSKRLLFTLSSGLHGSTVDLKPYY